MPKYNKVYFLHIPKTGGRFFTKYIINQIEPILKENGIDVLQLPEKVRKHGGWHEGIDDNTYIISVFRDPVEFFVSAVAHMVADQEKMVDKANDFVVIDNHKVIDISKEFLFDRLDQIKYLKDFQSQNFILCPQESFILHQARQYYDENFVFDKDLIYKRIARVNLMIRHKDLKSMDYNILIDKMSKDLEINIPIDISSADREEYKNNSSDALFNKLDKDDIQKVYNNFLFDKEIYENDSLFWTGK
jgi:hypothetical protein